MNQITKIDTLCRACGHGGCGVQIVKDGEKLIKVEGDKNHPISKGYTCKIARASIELREHPMRLRHPMKRAGARGEGKWEQISWEEALTTISDKLTLFKEESGAESVVFGHGTGRDFQHYLYRLAHLYGSPNVMTPGHMCYLPRIAISKVLGFDIPLVDYDNNPECLMVWGANHLNSNADEYCAINLANSLKRSNKVIVIDPRRTAVTERADLWLQLRPGTDSALALGMLHVIVKENLYDQDFVTNYASGFEQLAERLEQFPPEKVAEITWVPAEQIIEAARLFAAAKSGAIQWGVGIDQNVNCVDGARLLLNMVALTGNFDAPGGNVVFMPSPVMPAREFALFHKLPPEQQKKMLGGEQYKLGTIIGRLTPHVVWDAILEEEPYKVRGMLTFASNLLVIRENAHRVYEALKKIEFFVTTDLYRTPTVEMADIVLPATTWLEHDGVGDHWKSHGYVFPRNKVVEPVGEAWPDIKIFAELGKRLGFKEYFWDDNRESFDIMLKPAGLTWEEFKDMPEGLQTKPVYHKYKQSGFGAPGRKYEFYIHQLEEWGYDPLPDYHEPPEGPLRETEFVDKYPLILTTGSRLTNFFGSEGRQSELLRKDHPDPLVEIHPQAAAARGIVDGDWVTISSPRGEAKFKANVTDGIDARVVSADFGWWFPEKGGPEYGWRESNINFLTDDQGPNDPMIGATPLKGLQCEIRKI